MALHNSWLMNGSHKAIPCYECHRKQNKWRFRNIGVECKDCHEDIHKNFIQARYYPEANCKICHNEVKWQQVGFEHTMTDFVLAGTHSKIDCRSCHFRKDPQGVVRQVFKGLSGECSLCHKDNHFKQFDINGNTDCNRCHNTENWKSLEFDHNNTAFKLEGKHAEIACANCHKPVKTESVFLVNYKIKEFKCESCHF